MGLEYQFKGDSVKEEQYKRMQGQVKFYSYDRGYGFVKRESKLGMDVFFTSKALERAKIDKIQENDILEFDLVPIQGKGGRAINLKKVYK
jgi:cold shock CspA family protein